MNEMKTALVTGASRGLGAVIARRLAASGWAVALNYSRDTEGAEGVVRDITSAGGRAAAFRFDILQREALGAGLETIRARFGTPHLIVNNATGPQPELPIEAQAWDHYVEQFAFMVKAPFELLQLVLPEWRARRHGRVVNIGSEVAEIGNPNFGHYVAAKGAMLSATRSWANELAYDGITVNLVAPGWIPVERHRDVSDERRERYLSRVPSGRFGTPEDIAAAVVFLASPEAGHITGQRLAVNGGRTF